jgi:hypothetical protein
MRRGNQRHDDGLTKHTLSRQWYVELDTGPATDGGRVAFCAFDIQHGPQQRRPARLFQL